MVARDLQLGKKPTQNINHFLLKDCRKFYSAAQKNLPKLSIIIMMLSILFRKRFLSIYKYHALKPIYKRVLQNPEILLLYICTHSHRHTKTKYLHCGCILQLCCMNSTSNTEEQNYFSNAVITAWFSEQRRWKSVNHIIKKRNVKAKSRWSWVYFPPTNT